MHILSNETPTESNTQTVQETKTMTNKHENQGQANQLQAHAYINFVIFAVYISMLFPYYRIESKTGPGNEPCISCFIQAETKIQDQKETSLMLVWMQRYS